MDNLFEIKGVVIKNKQRGRKLGFPTANIASPPDEVPDGIFIGYTIIDGKKHKSLIFIGRAETFGETERFAESHILDFNEDIYGKEVTLQGIKKLRDSRKFYDVKEMLDQMKEDEKIARVLLEE